MQILTAIRLLLSLNYRTSNHQEALILTRGAVSDGLGAKESEGTKRKPFRTFLPDCTWAVSVRQVAMVMLDIPISFPVENFLKVELKHSNPKEYCCFRVDEPTIERVLKVPCQSRRSHQYFREWFIWSQNDYYMENSILMCAVLKKAGTRSIKLSLNIPWSWVIDWRSHMIREKCEGNMDHSQLEGIPSVVF